MSEVSIVHQNNPGRYEIRLKGHLDSRWSAWFDGLSLTNENDGTTVIHGPVVDQAALHGLLQKLRDTGLPLVSVTQVEPDQPDVPPTSLDHSPIHERKDMAITGKESDMAITVMTPTTKPTATKRVPMTSARKSALVGGLFYVITFASSIPAFFLLDPVLSDPNYVLGFGADGLVVLGLFLDLVNALACIGSAVALFSVLKRQHEGFALGFVTTRIFEAAVIMIGVLSLLAVVTLRQSGAAAGADASSLVTVGQALVATRDWTFLIGPSVMASLNAVLLGTLMYRSRLVPRVIPLLGLIGAPLLLSWAIGTFFGISEGGTVWHTIGLVPIFIWELSLGIWLVVKGFKPSAITTGIVDDSGTPSTNQDVTA